MSEENIEIYRKLVEAFNRGGVEEVLQFFAEDVEVYDPDLPADQYRGREGVRKVIEQLVGGAESTEVRDYELVPAGDRVVGLMRTYFRGAGGGPEIEMRDAHTMTFRDGKIVYWRLYLDRNEALADAGLEAREGSSPG